jgi:hypothetical protein
VIRARWWWDLVAGLGDDSYWPSFAGVSAKASHQSPPKASLAPSSEICMVDTPRPCCPLCGKTSVRTCGFHHTPRFRALCGLQGSRWALARVDLPPELTRPHESEVDPRRCGAHARTTGEPCRRLKLKGASRCRLHGGRSTGPASIHGKRTLRQQRDRHLVLMLCRLLRLIHPKPAPIPVIQDPSTGAWHLAERDPETGGWELGRPLRNSPEEH